MTQSSDRPASPAGDPGLRRPAGMCLGPGHVVVHGNAAFVARFGRVALGLPAREGMLDLPPEAFRLFDVVLRGGRPLARWISGEDEDWRLTVAPRLDPETQQPYGVRFHLRARSDLPVRRTLDPDA